MGLTIRPLTAETLEPFARLVERLYVEDPGPISMSYARALQQASDILQRPERVAALFLLDEDVMVGYALLVTCYSNEYGGDIVYLDELYIVPDKRGSGLGSGFLEYLKAWAREQGLWRISLEVHSGNANAARLYTRVGFETDPRAVYGFQLRPLDQETPGSN